MGGSTIFDYYYGDESNLFSFYRIPRQLITGDAFKRLSTDAKLLYGLLLDRMSLSAKHGWYDEQGRVYKRSGAGCRCMGAAQPHPGGKAIDPQKSRHQRL